MTARDEGLEERSDRPNWAGSESAYSPGTGLDAVWRKDALNSRDRRIWRCPDVPQGVRRSF